MSLAVGTRVGPYEIAGVVGAGGMGEVYKARDTRLGRDVALKMLPAELSQSPDSVRRFETEARATSALSHPNVLAVHDFGRHDGAPYLVCELLEGETLRQRLADGALTARKALELGGQIALGLAAAHDKGIVHRDLKPDNVFITREGRVKILDFGLAKLVDDAVHDPAAALAETAAGAGAAKTEAGTVLGTAGYMAPEQVRGQAVDARADLFSLGVVLYEMLAGKRPFGGDSRVEIAHAILKDDPPPLPESVERAAALDAIIHRCLEKRAEERFQSARDLAFQLQTFSGTTAAGAITSARHARRGPPPVQLLAGLVVIASVAAFVAGRKSVSRAGVAQTDGPTPPPAPTSSPVFEQVTFDDGRIHSARFAPDGRSVLFEEDFASGAQIYGSPIGSPGRRALAGTNIKLVAASSRGDLGVFQHGGLGTMPLAGGAPRMLAEGARVGDFSPDGESLAVAHLLGTGETQVEYPIGNALYTSLSAITNLRVSPDGRKVALIEHPIPDDMSGWVEIVGSGMDSMKLGPDWGSLLDLAWQPDGDAVWVAADPSGTDTQLYALPLTGSPRLIFSVPGALGLYDIAPDGRVLLSRSTYRTHVVGQRLGAPPIDLSWFDQSTAAGLSGDGSQLLLDEGGQASGLEVGSNYVTYLRPISGSEASRLSDGKAFALSPDGQWALVVPAVPPSDKLEIVPTAAGTSTRLPPGPITVYGDWGQWFADDQHVIFDARTKTETFRLWLQDVKGDDPSPISPPGVQCACPTPLSPDGKTLLVQSMGVTGVSLLTIDDGTAGGAPTAANPTLRSLEGLAPGESVIRFTADGTGVLVQSGGPPPWAVTRLDLASGGRTPQGSFGGADGAASAEEDPGSALATPDGKTFAWDLTTVHDTVYVAIGLAPAKP
jgi:tRNA A-37 threonylcarbamoyl transferase component Bud32